MNISGGSIRIAGEDLRLVADVLVRRSPSVSAATSERQLLIDLAAQMYAFADRPGEPQSLFIAPDERLFLHDALERLDAEEISTELGILRLELDLVGVY